MEFVADRRERLDVFVTRALDSESRTRLAAHIASGCVLVDGRPRKAGFWLEAGMAVSVQPLSAKEPQKLQPADIPIEVQFEDEYLMVVNKPPGLSVHPSPTSSAPTLVHALLGHGFRKQNTENRKLLLSTASGEFRPGIVHRLDKDTSGLMLVAKTDAVHRALQTAIQKREVVRVYWAWVKGIPDKEEFTIQSHVGRHPKNRQKMAIVSESAPDARIAITHCTVLESKSGISKIECRLDTGRTHQIRVHLASVGLPVLGDAVYGVACPGLVRQALHAVRLSFVHPITGKEISLEAPLPGDLAIFA